MAEDDNAITLSADSTRWYQDDKVTATGNVQASYKDYKVTADSAEADLQTNIAVFQGKVKLVTGKNTVEGERLTLNLKTKEWNLEEASSVISPAVLQGRTTAPAFLHGASLSGTGDDLTLESGALTTCDKEHPHYFFSAKELEIHPGSKIIARRVSLVGLDKRLFSLNSLIIPIKGFSSNFLPQIGSSADEGMFLKTSYAYMATDQAQGLLKLDLMQKRGIGLGIDQTYKMGIGSGNLALYYLADRELGGNNISGRLQHHQKLGSIDLNINSDYRANSYLYYPTSTTQNMQVSLARNSSNTNTILNFNSNSNRGFGNYKTLTSSLRHTQQFSDKLNGVFSMDMRTYDSSSIETADRELESEFELTQRENKYDLTLVASRRTDLDGSSYTGDDFYSSLDRLPELTFDTDSYRMGKGLLFGLPSRLSVSAGRYHEEPSGITSGRLLLQLDMLGFRKDIGSKTDLNLTAGYRQAYYDSDAAQYMLKLNGVMTTRFNDYLKTRLTYNYQQPEGFSPFLFDYTGTYNYTRLVFDYQDNKKLRWSLSTGYDLKSDSYPWQDLALRLTANPSSKYAYSISTGYDINNSKWRSLITQFRVLDTDGINLDLGTRYDIQQGKLSLARGLFKIPIGKKWRVDGITGWNGTTGKFDYKSFRLTRDLHCWEASITYNDETGFRENKGISLDFRIKAFPGVDRFGIGQYGQAIDTSMGEFYY